MMVASRKLTVQDSLRYAVVRHPLKYALTNIALYLEQHIPVMSALWRTSRFVMNNFINSYDTLLQI